MNPLERGDAHLLPLEFTERITLNRALKIEEQFQQWLDQLEPRFCQRHPRRPLLLNRDASRRQTLPDHTIQTGSPWDCLRGERSWSAIAQGALTFQAVFHLCPGCVLDFAQVKQHRCGFLVLCGFNGNGKTMLACCIVREVDFRKALYITQGQFTLIHRRTYAQRFHHMVRRQFDDDGQVTMPKTIWQLCQEVPVLVFDEIGAKALSPDELLIVDEVIKCRYDRRKPTILITNLALTGTPEKPGLKEFLGDALTDRIRHASGNGRFILQFSGESYRRAGESCYLDGLL